MMGDGDESAVWGWTGGGMVLTEAGWRNNGILSARHLLRESG